MKLPDIQINAQGLQETRRGEWAARFLFGGFVSFVAGLVSRHYGPAIGGLFLAFPSILPATVTLVTRHKGREKAADDAWGAALGSFGLLAFAIVVALTAESWSEARSLGAATGAWLAASALCWLIAG